MTLSSQPKEVSFSRRGLEECLSWIILMGGLAAIGLAAYMVIASYSPLPYWDAWGPLRYFSDVPRSAFVPWLWHQHNETSDTDYKITDCR